MPTQTLCAKSGMFNDEAAATSCLRGETLPVDSLQNAPGQPRYQPICSYRGPMQEAEADSQAL